VNKKKKKKQEEKDHAIKEEGTHEADIKTHKKQILDLEEFFVHVKSEEREVPLASVQPYLEDEDTRNPLTALDRNRRGADKKVREILRSVSENAKILQRETERLMNAFKSPRQEILAQFPDWPADVFNLEPRMDYYEDFLTLSKRIETENLPEFKQRFRKYMNEAVLDRVVSFKNTLDLTKDEISEQIDRLNEPLRRIDFRKRPLTFIQLAIQPNRADKEISGVRNRLQECIPNVADKTLGESEAWMKKTFDKIHALIQDLQNDPVHRKKVIDVRNWLEFTAEEFTREDEKRYNSYDSSGSLSGGEKAQFTYTILGAAIAYQFGINRDDHSSRSFRFIAVDEAFSKLDPEKSGYLMELCKQLHLQLLVVTPLDKIHIAEPYISACHYVENRDRKLSKVYNMTMTQYQQMKKDFEKQAAQN
jgi:uncharacterized protein YPO0396